METAVLTAEERIVEGLSEAQREAVVHGDGPLLIIAGAGTGKTTVLTRRIAHLISGKRGRPEEILALTFTEKAAVEMAERVDQLIPYGYAETWISTFHAFGDHVLRTGAIEAGLDPDFRVLTRPEQIIFLRERLFRLPMGRFRPLGNPTGHLQALLALVSRAKDEDVSPLEYLDWASARVALATTDDERDEAERQIEIATFYKAYQEHLLEAGVVDFGDQIARALGLLRERASLLDRFRRKYRYILVDEFQDTNHAQLELIRLLAGRDNPNITVVGDDDQAIYRWRGAASGNLLAFRRLYPAAREVVLTENHRSTQPILDVAGRLISYNNPQRLEVLAGIDKRLRSPRSAGLPARHLHFDTLSSEADGVARLVEERLAEGRAPRDVAILVRSNSDADPFLRALNVRGLPHRFSGSRGLYSREEIRLLVSFLRALANPADSVSLFYLACSDVYRFPETDLLRVNHYARRKTRPLLDVLRGLPDNEDLASVGGAARNAAARIVADLDQAAADVPRLRTGEVLYRFLRSSGILARLSRETSAEAEAQAKNIARFFDLVRAYGDVAEHDRVPTFVEHLDMLRDAGDDPALAEADLDEDAVHVLTVHKAKGLEFPVVILVSCVEGRFPVRGRGEALELPVELEKEPAAPGDVRLQEERRLFYVGMTRAKDELIFTSAADYGTARPRKLSRFVVEALDLLSPSPLPRRTRALEALARHEPTPVPLLPAAADAGRGDPETLRLSFGQMDDYRTCPLKYRYVHVLRVPLLAHHRVVYGSAVHKAIQRYFQARLLGRELPEEDLLSAFRAAWVSEGFLSREHEEERLKAGEEALRRFHRQDAAEPLFPTAVEKEFSFRLEPEGAASRPPDPPLAHGSESRSLAAPAPVLVTGRYDLVVEREGHVSILDFKTSAMDDEKKAKQRALESLQLDLYALAYLRTEGRLPDWVELRFLESGLAGGKAPTPEEARRTEDRILEVSEAIRRRQFPATPSFMACGQCAFREICPFTARASEAG